ncbi:N-acetylmuramoyl-L-alanine amidase [Lacihabitans sp. LS3-19]|uniref:N-acetylmuramoyl-L-alanine amidase family protein n=1 Tax=Lacihabitans sp. LS3-19 TaxID=2487335 RepID=UPI0020CDF5A9|nr:N-acetylmuramoyl-L-alanine amidase [Lacihabitans sp. LS3-19]
MKLINLKIIIPFTLLTFTYLIFTSHTSTNPVRITTIVLDAGHGGKDPGAGNGREKKYALDITLKLGQKIKQRHKDVKVIYTRDSDVFIPLHERAAIANKNKADLFISIHCNANNTRSLSGTETYVMGLHKTQENLDLAKNENNVILYEDNYKKTYKGYNPASPLAHIMLANYQNAFMNQSLEFAAKVEKNIPKIGYRSRGVKQAGFIVIWETTMPSVLVETGYLTNSRDANFLATEDGREKVALAISNAFDEYKKETER